MLILQSNDSIQTVETSTTSRIEEPSKEQQRLDPIENWLENNVEITCDRKDYVCLKVLKKKLQEAQLFKQRFEKDCEFVNYIKAYYSNCEYNSGQERIGDVRITNFIRNLRFIH
jgi:hypothetical protein